MKHIKDGTCSGGPASSSSCARVNAAWVTGEDGEDSRIGVNIGGSQIPKTIALFTIHYSLFASIGLVNKLDLLFTVGFVCLLFAWIYKSIGIGCHDSPTIHSCFTMKVVFLRGV